MKCADCKFWAPVKEAFTSCEASEGTGMCRRNAPRPASETAVLLLHILKEQGTLAPFDHEDVRPADWQSIAENPFARLNIWPTTWGTDFCGDFVSRQERQGFV